MTHMVVIGRWTRWVLLAAIGVLAVVLLISALVGGSRQATAGPEPTAQPVAVSTPTPTPEPEPLPWNPDQRFLALDGGGVLWRGTAGSCADGIPPKLERTADAVVWRIATPADAAQLLALTPGDVVDQASVVIALDDGSCTVEGRVTAPDGQSWEVAPASSVDVAPATDAIFTTEDGYVARQEEGCDGVAFSGGDWTACEPGLDPAAPIAIDYADGRLYVWSGDVLTSLPVG